MACHPFLALAAGLFAFHIAGLPLLFKYTKLPRRKLVFTDFWNFPVKINFSKPTQVGIKGAKNFCVDFISKVDDCYIKLGAWYVCPQTQLFSENLDYETATVRERILCDLQFASRPIVLYCHGNSNHRGSPMRIQTYKMFQQLNFHVITFDYRGYGDSTKIQPTEQGVVEDTLQMYSWIHEMFKNVSACLKPPVVLWGHSLGSSVAANLTANIADICHNMLDKNKCLPSPDGLVLEAPFNNLVDQMKHHPYSKLVNWLPYFKSAFVDPIATSSEFSFTTDDYLKRAPHVPVLILHSRKDELVPYCLAARLHKVVSEAREESGGAPLIFHTFEKKYKVGHNNISLAPETKDVVKEFIVVVEEEKKDINKKEKRCIPKFKSNTLDKISQSETLKIDLEIQNDNDAVKEMLEMEQAEREKERERLEKLRKRLKKPKESCYRIGQKPVVKSDDEAKENEKGKDGDKPPGDEKKANAGANEKSKSVSKEKKASAGANAKPKSISKEKKASAGVNAKPKSVSKEKKVSAGAKAKKKSADNQNKVSAGVQKSLEVINDIPNPPLERKEENKEKRVKRVGNHSASVAVFPLQ